MSKPRLPDKDFKWTTELAYAVGLLTTDGNLSKDGRHLDFTSKDRKLVELFIKCLNLNNKIGRKSRGGTLEKKYYRIQFGNVVFYRWLQRIGLTPNKSKTISAIKIPDKYFRDFLRGHLDGDGDITTYTDYYNTYKNPKYIYTRLYVRFLSASEYHMRWIQNKIRELIPIKGHLTKRELKRKSRTIMWAVRFAKKESFKILSWLYYSPTVPCLIRKRKIAEKFIKI